VLARTDWNEWIFRVNQMVPVLRIFALLSASLALWAGPGAAQSALLDSVKANPALAKDLCVRLRQLNAQGVASNSPQAVSMVAREQNLSPMDAEVLTTYVVGLHCPDVR
jgi:hypothetical protein